jgi:DNA ligase-1
MTTGKAQAFDRHDEGTFTGIMAADWIRDLESSDSRLHKEAVIEKALMAARLGSSSAQCFLYNCYLALNPFFVYGVKKVAESSGLTDRENPWVSFWALCESLRTRSVTGGDARGAIDAMMARFDSEQWNGLARRVLIKDLRCGVSEKTINKICTNSEWAIPTFECQLAQDSGDHPRKLKGNKRLEVKLDGVRVLAMCYARSGTVNLMSRNGKAFTNFDHIEQQLIPHIKRISTRMFNSATDFVLDGEIVGESFQALMRQAQRKKDADAADSIYHVFDVLPMEDFYRGHWNAQQRRRLDRLESIREILADYCPSVEIMPGMTVDLDTAEGHDIMRRFADASVEQGYEGIMIKDLEAPYECKRSSFWMKWKPTITVDLNIVGFEEGTGRNLGRLGALICEGEDSGRVIRVNVGSGLRDGDRDEFWSSRVDLLDRVVEVEADAVTQNQDGTYSLRFPRFVRFRGWEPGEKM